MSRTAGSWSWRGSLVAVLLVSGCASAVDFCGDACDDAGPFDGGDASVDGGAEDAGFDAGLDAEVDSGLDAGLDGGEVDPARWLVWLKTPDASAPAIGLSSAYDEGSASQGVCFGARVAGEKLHLFDGALDGLWSNSVDGSNVYGCLAANDTSPSVDWVRESTLLQASTTDAPPLDCALDRSDCLFALTPASGADRYGYVDDFGVSWTGISSTRVDTVARESATSAWLGGQRTSEGVGYGFIDTVERTGGSFSSTPSSTFTPGAVSVFATKSSGALFFAGTSESASPTISPMTIMTFPLVSDAAGSLVFGAWDGMNWVQAVAPYVTTGDVAVVDAAPVTDTDSGGWVVLVSHSATASVAAIATDSTAVTTTGSGEGAIIARLTDSLALDEAAILGGYVPLALGPLTTGDWVTVARPVSSPGDAYRVTIMNTVGGFALGAASRILEAGAIVAAVVEPNTGRVYLAGHPEADGTITDSETGDVFSGPEGATAFIYAYDPL